MNVLIVGGTGLVGAEAARHLRDNCHDVTIMSRKPPSSGVPAEFPHMAYDYVNEDIAPSALASFDAVVFAAAADIRMLPEGDNPHDFFHHANVERVPAFMRTAKDAGVKRAVYIGTFYPHVAKYKIDVDPYVTSRYYADQAIRALSDDDFNVCTLDAPFILGHVDGVSAPHIEYLVQYAAGRLPDMPFFAPDGGTNHISSKSLAEAILGGLENGKGGKAYLVGDENLSWKSYFEAFCAAANNQTSIEVRQDEHPLLPDMIMYCGRNATVSYEPENGELNYSQNQISKTIGEVARAYI